MFSDGDYKHDLPKYQHLPSRSSAELALTPVSLDYAIAPAADSPQHKNTKTTQINIGSRFKFNSNTQSLHRTEAFNEAGLARYTWEKARRTRTKRIAYCVALVVAALVLSGVLAWALASRPPPLLEPDLPLEWNITRSMWGADPEPSPIFPLDPAVIPLRLVVIQHTAGETCYQFEDCAVALRRMQRRFLAEFGWDVPYNYLVGNEGRIYEGRGWEGGEAAHLLSYNRCSLGLGFMGNYWREGGTARATPLQLERALTLLEGGVRDGMLHPRYIVVAARDLRTSHSPGDDLYDALRQWPNFNVDTQRFRGRSCEDIYDELRALDHLPLPSAGSPGSRDTFWLMLLLCWCLCLRPLVVLNR